MFRALLLLIVMMCPPLWAGDVRALNRGRFEVTYRLVRDGPRVWAEDVRVRLANRAEFYETPTEALRAHEEGHRRINEAERGRIEEELEKFEMEAGAGQKNMRAAEKAFRARFAQAVKHVEEFHRAWDATHKVPISKASR